MIKIKKQEFVKFLSLLNEMRSSYSASQIENVGEENNTPIDKTQEMGGLQLATSLPDLTDPEWEPASNTELRNALIAIAKEVPSNSLDDFFRRAMKAFEKTIDQMPEEENPFNPEQLAESLVYLFENNEDKEEDEEDEDEEINKQVEDEMEKDDPADDDYYDEKMRQIAFSTTGTPSARKEYEEEDSREDVEKLPSLSNLSQPKETEEDPYASMFASLGFDPSDFDDNVDSDVTDAPRDDSSAIEEPDPFADLDIENMSLEDLLSVVQEEEGNIENVEIYDPEDIEKERRAEDLYQGWDPEGEVLECLNEILSAIRSFMLYRKIQILNKVYKPDQLKQAAATAGLAISTEKLQTGMSKKQAAAVMDGERGNRKNLARVATNISAAYFFERELIADQLAYDSLPDYLHDLAVLNDFPRKFDEPSKARTLAINGIKKLLNAVTNSQNLLRLVEKAQKESEQVVNEKMKQENIPETRRQNLINAEMQKKYNEVLSDKSNKKSNMENQSRDEILKNAEEAMMTPKRFEGTQSYLYQLSLGTKEEVQNTVMTSYLRLARLGYYMMKSRLTFGSTEEEKVEKEVIVKQDGSKRIKIKSKAKPAAAIGDATSEGSIFQIFLTNAHPLNKAINGAVTQFITSMPYVPDAEEFEFELEQMFESEQGIASPDKAIEVAQKISKKQFIDMDIYESWVWSSCYYYMYEATKKVQVMRDKDWKNALMKPQYLNKYIPPGYDRNRPVMKPGETSKEWILLSSEESKSANSLLEGVDQQVYDTIHDFVEKTLQSPMPNIRVIQKSSEETGGDVESNVPKETFCYLVPFIFASMWQKEIVKHFVSYKRQKRKPAEIVTFQGEVKDMEKFLEKEGNYLKNLGAFVGMKNASGVQKMLRQYIGQRDYFLTANLVYGQENPGGRAYATTWAESFSSAAFSLKAFLEKYIETIKRARDAMDDNEDAAKYWDEELKTITKVFTDMSEIDEILSEYSIWEIEEMEEDKYDLLSDLSSEDPEEEGALSKLSGSKFTNLNDKLDDLLHNTVAGHMIREISHNSMIKSPKVSQSFLPELEGSMKKIISNLIINYPSFSFPNPAMNRMNPLMKQNMVGKLVEVFLSWQNCQLNNIQKATQNAMSLDIPNTTQTFLSYGIDLEAYKKIKFTSAIIYDYIFAIVLSSPGEYKKLKFDLKKALNEGQYGYKGQNLEEVLKAVEEVIKKLVPMGIYKLSQKRLTLINDAASDKAMFEAMTEFIDSQINIAEISKEISDLKTRYDSLLEIEIKKYIKSKNTKREDLKPEDFKIIEKPIKKERSEILNLAKELNGTISKIEKTMIRPLEIIKK